MKHWLFAILALTVVSATPAAAQQPCPYGRTLFGGCISPQMDERARTKSILMVQRRVSVSQQLTLPRDDRSYLSAGARNYIR
ncbi:MAG: hypothetical protein ACRCTI_05650 [Beijerinckiaceae bacterium]